MKNRNLLILIISLAIGLSFPGVTAAETPEETAMREQAEKQYAFGNVFGRMQAEERGFVWESVLIADAVSNFRGGAKTGTTALGLYTLSLNIDTGKAGWWENGEVMIHPFVAFGGNPSEYVGDYQYTDNIEVKDSINFVQLWYKHYFASKKLAFIVGIQDFNINYYIRNSALTLLNTSFCFGPEMGQVVPPSFPASGFGVSTEIKPADPFYLQAGLFDGDVADPRHFGESHYFFSGDDGLFMLGEMGIDSQVGDDEDAPHRKLALGGWYHTKEFVDFSDTERDRNWGWYVLGETPLYQDSLDPVRALSAFAHFGYAPQDRNEVGTSFSVGLNYVGLIPSRSRDALAFGVAQARSGDDFMEANGLNRAETAYDLTYKIQIYEFLSVQPDLQWVVNPSMDPEQRNAFVGTLRFQLTM